MSKDLDRRIARARKNLDPRTLPLETPELPFEAVEEAPQGPVKAATSKRGRPKRVTTPQIDLFTLDGPPQEAAAAEAEPEVPLEEPPVEAAPIESEVPLSAPPPEAQAEPEPHHLDPQAVMLQRVDPRNLRPTDRADSYLYHITNGPDADVALRQGISVSASDPVILTERQGVAYWLSVLAEDYDYILDGPADFVVLRLRRMAVEELLEHDPYASRSAGCPCYLLTGGVASRAQAPTPARSR